MNRIIASFTSGERNIIVFVLAMVAGGYGMIEWKSAQRKEMTFSAGPSALIGELSVPDVMPTGMDGGGLVDVNVADGKVLETLPGIGPSLAAAIIRHRTSNGAITSLADLDEVPGIGPAMMTKLASLVTFGTGPGTLALPVAPAIGAPAFAIAPLGIPASTASALININKADPVELDKLKGIGPALAQRIIQDRQQRGLFRSTDDLLRVKGIGPKILQDNRNRLTTN